MNNSLKVKFISSLEKCFVDEDINKKPELFSFSMLKNEKYSFGVAYQETDKAIYGKAIAFCKVKADIGVSVSVKKVCLVPVMMAAYHNNYDENYLRRESGLYPDLLTPCDEAEPLYLVPNALNSLFIMVEPNDKVKAGKITITVSFYDEKGELLVEKSLCGKVINQSLPEQDIAVAQWFHADCLASYYKVEPLSDEHFVIIDNFLQTAVEYGITQILTPVFTPPLDTAVDGERPTVQLVEVYKNNGEYSFGFNKLNKWIEICEKNKIKTYEICHLFTQWGANHAPKIMAEVDGEYKRIFGWETDAFCDEYRTFLRVFLKELLTYFDEKQIPKDRVVFHVSDEPSLEHLENYKRAKEIIADVVEGHKIMDALSNYEFYKLGLVQNPIPANDHMHDFLENNVPDLWTYYCCGQCVGVSNRFMSMPSARNRIIATQFYKFNIAGFLQWGYNFYYNQFSKRLIDPYRVTDGEYFAPSGDAFSVYPAENKTAYESIRLVVFNEALQDLRAMKLCEKLYSREYVMHLIEDGLETPIAFDSFPCKAEYILNLREKINNALEAKV